MWQHKCPSTLQVEKVGRSDRIAPWFDQGHLIKNSVAVMVGADGCAADNDRDGVPDHLDYCLDDTPLTISAGVTRQGCPLQSDGDGTPDYREECPGTLRGIPTDRFGCPKQAKALDNI